MSVQRTKGLFSVLVAFFLVLAMQSLTAVNVAHADVGNMYLSFTPDPAIQKPITKYRVAYWADGKENTPAVQLFDGMDNGKLNAVIRPGSTNGTVNFQLYTTDTVKTGPNDVDNRTWESAVFKKVPLGSSIVAAYNSNQLTDPDGKPIVTGAPAPTPIPPNPPAVTHKVVVTFTPQPGVDESEYNLWVWGDGDKKVLFTGKDSQGRLTAEIVVSESVTKIGMLLRRGDGWDKKITGDIQNVPVPGRVDIKSDGSFEIASGLGTTPKPKPKLTEVTLTVHYVRWDEDYENWNIWSWIDGKNGARYGFDSNHTATYSLADPAGIAKVGLIVRKSVDGNDWAQKNSKDDLFIDNFPGGKAEIWIVQGDAKIYYSQAELPAKPSNFGACTKLHTKAFNDQYYYDGELGAIYTPASTTFRVWAPTAQKVEFVNYSRGGATQLMNAGAKGTWEITLSGDQKGTEYRYRLTFPYGKVNETVDPYARAVTANSTRTVVEDAEGIRPANWNGGRMPAFTSMKDAIIYEAHVRDLTIDPNNGIQHKGKFLGLTEPGTKTAQGNLSGLDYLKSLGVTHVQLLPIYDFGSVNENDDLGFGKQYNWGYDPQNYNVPEGSYATDPANPQARIRELKQLVDTLHQNGIRVIMDVVYNHVYDPKTSPLQLTVPDYYFRMDDACNFHNGTGVGNETASEQPMMRKYIIDSLKYWAKNYNLDGFRFDLMGILDVKTMQQVRAELNQIDPSIVILGEGWEMGKHPAGSLGANQNNAKQLPGIAFFNDSYRDTVKGDNFELSHSGFVNGANQEQRSWDLLNNIKGGQYVRHYLDPNQSVVYNEAHDNYTMYDKLKGSTPGASEAEIAKRHALATATQYLANGSVFIHAGQEFLRTKGGDHNSYQSPDSVNRLDYDRAAFYPENVEFFRKLNSFRKQYDFMRQPSYEAVNKRYAHDFAAGSQKTVETNHVSYLVKDAYRYGSEKSANAYVYINADTRAWNAPLPAGKYETLIKGLEVYEVPPALTSDGQVEVPPLSIMVMLEWTGTHLTPPSPPKPPIPAPNPGTPGGGSTPSPSTPAPVPPVPGGFGSGNSGSGGGSGYVPSYSGGGSGGSAGGGSSSGSSYDSADKSTDEKPESKKPTVKPAAPQLSVFDKQFTKPLKLEAKAVLRAAGRDRVATSLAALSLVQNHETVVLATGNSFPDALVGGALAGAFKGGVVLTTGMNLEQSVIDSLQSYKTRTVYIIGGENAVSAQKKAALKAAGLKVMRLAGASRYETARAVKAATLRILGGKSVVTCVATGSNFPDALACSSAASLQGGVVDLVKPGASVTKDVVSARTMCAGGSACVGAQADVTKVIGSDRYDTAYRVALSGPDKGKVVVSSGMYYADSLVASALSASTGARLFLSNGRRVNVPADTKSAHLVGGNAVLPDNLPMFTK